MTEKEEKFAKKLAENMLEIMELKGLFSRVGKSDLEIQEIISIFETELLYSYQQGKNVSR